MGGEMEMVDFGEIALKAKREAEGTDVRAAKDAGTAVLRDRVLPILKRAKEEIEKSRTKVSCSIESRFEPGQKSLVVFTCSGTPMNDPDEGKLERVTVPIHLDSDGKTLDARLAKHANIRGIETGPWSSSVPETEAVIARAISAALLVYHKLRLRA
jgi:hypothetical protein